MFVRGRERVAMEIPMPGAAFPHGTFFAPAAYVLVNYQEWSFMRLPCLPRISCHALALFAAAFLFGTPAAFAQDSDFNLSLHANSHTSAAEIGLPAYPGATIYKGEDKGKDKDDDSTLDVGFSSGDTHFRLMAASYLSSDSPEKILAFYRKPLSKYGEVLECDHGKPVGSLTVTRSGLSCSEQRGHVQVNGSSDSNDHELRAGTPRQFRIVGIDEAHPNATHFGLVYIELPKDTDEKSK
jgi:hypothetical protein